MRLAGFAVFTFGHLDTKMGIERSLTTTAFGKIERWCAEAGRKGDTVVGTRSE
jgi:hypothetical protein